MTPEDLEILQGLTSPDELTSSGPLYCYLIACGIILLGLLAASIKVIYQTTISNRLKKRLEPYDTALTRLEQLKQQAPDTKTAALKVSYIFREMLEEKVGDKALYETNEEFSQRADALTNIHLSLREETRHFLQKLARLKYVPKDTEENTESIINEAIRLINSIIQIIENEDKKKK